MSQYTLFLLLSCILSLSRPTSSLESLENKRTLPGKYLQLKLLQKKGGSLSEHLNEALRHHHLVMIGDSLMRHQYLSMVYILLNMTIPNHYAKQPSSWFHHFNESMDTLKPFEFCDCYRTNTFDYDKFAENRYFRNPAYNISVTYIQYFGKDSSGHWFDSGDWDEFRKPRPQYLKQFWSLKIQDVIRDMLPKMTHPVTLLMINYDHWDFSPHRKPFVWDAALSATVHQVALELLELGSSFPARKLIWKTGTWGHPSFESNPACNRRYIIEERDSSFCSLASVTCFDVSWTKLPAQFYVDHIHFVSDVYDLMNIQFLFDTLKNGPKVLNYNRTSHLSPGILPIVQK